MNKNLKFILEVFLRVLIITVIFITFWKTTEPKNDIIDLFAVDNISSDAPILKENPTEGVSVIDLGTVVPPEVPKDAVDGTVVFSSEAGFYENDLTLAMASKDNKTILYSLDGSLPAKGSGSTYVSPLKLSMIGTSERIFVVRAAAFDGDKIIGQVFTKTFIVSSNIKGRYSTPVISLVTDSSNFYNPENGLFTTTKDMDLMMKKGKEWERPCHVEFFENNGITAFSQDAGIRLFGGTSRNMSQKSFRLFARKEYGGPGEFNYAIFPNHTARTDSTKLIDKYDSFILRNAANDSVFVPTSNDRATFIRDTFSGRMASRTGVDYMDGRPATVYINGTYYGLLNIREDLSDNYIQYNYNIPKDQVAIMGSQIEFIQPIRFYYALDSGPANMADDYNGMLDFIINNDMADVNKYNEASAKLDTQGFIKYMAYEMYIANTDWPQNNVRAWRFVGENDANIFGKDGKWRFMYKDLDFAFARYDMDKTKELYSRHDTDTFKHVFNNYYKDPLKLGGVLKSLLNNDSFRVQFVNYMCDIMNDVVSPARAKQMLEISFNEVSYEMPYNFQKWTNSKDITQWITRFESIRNFIDLRPDAMAGFMKITPQLKVKTISTIKIVKSGNGTVRINTVNVLDANWEGKYFNGLPVIITAIPDPGASFNGFSTSGKISVDNPSSSQATISISGDGTITANFS